MIELTKHIEILLLENDCVIVPGLGGFIAHHQSAHYEEDEGVFLPPTQKKKKKKILHLFSLYNECLF